MMNSGILQIRSPLKFLVSISVPAIAAIAGTLFTEAGPGTWYDTLAKPWFTPPGWLFALVWIPLYLLMGISLYLIWMEITSGKEIGYAVSLFLIQLTLNVLWSWAFFTLQSPLFALMELILLWVAVASTLALFYQINRIAGILLVPYLVWVTFAGYLVLLILRMNP